jgi:hypothetical protein
VGGRELRWPTRRGSINEPLNSVLRLSNRHGC